MLIMLGMQSLERRVDVRLSKTRIEQANRLQEYLYGMQIIKSYHMQGKNFGQLERACKDDRDASVHVESSVGPLNFISATFLRSGLCFMTIADVYLVLGGSLDVPAFAMFLLVGTRIFDPLAVAIMNYSELIM